MTQDLFENIKIFLPKYLSDEQLQSLLKELHKQYGHLATDALYSPFLGEDNKLLQGDGVQNLLVINLPDTTVSRKPCMVTSNSCDNQLDNERFFETNVSYCPIFNLEKYQKALLADGENTADVDNHINAIRRQQVSQIFYLPTGHKLPAESFIFFDKIVSCGGGDISRDELKDARLFRLSNAGFYLFLLKLSIHATRVQENFDRDKKPKNP